MLKIKAIFLSLLFSFCSIFLYAKADVSFSFGINTKIGEHREKVLKDGALISLLQWQLLGATSVDLGLDIYGKYIHFSHLSSLGFPQLVGSMKDSDYMGRNSVKVLFSMHDAFLKEHFSSSEKIGFMFNLLPNKESGKISFSLEPIIGFYFSHIKWHAKNGYTQYEGEDGSIEWKPSWPKVGYNGGGVEYEKKSFLPFVALDATLTIIKTWELKFDLLFSPFLVVYAKDIHFDTKKTYFDTFRLPGFALKTNFLLEYKLNSRFSIYGGLGFVFFNHKSGETTVVDRRKDEIIAQFSRGSAGLSAIEGNLAMGFRFWL